jgi:hypothetical protein
MIAYSIALAAAAALPSVTAQSSADEVEFGQPFQLTVTVGHPIGIKANLPAPLNLGDDLVELGRSSSTTRLSDGLEQHIYQLELAAYRVGRIEIPSIVVTYVVGGTARSIRTGPVPIQVTSVVAESSPSLRPMSNPGAVLRPNWGLRYGAAAAVGSLGLVGIGLLVRGRRRRRRAEAQGPESARGSPRDEAMNRLVALEASGALDDDNLKPAFTALSEIVRGFLGRRFGLPALDLTTAEINRWFTDNDSGRAICAELAQWFTTCDAVKFADYPSSPEEARAALYQARRLIQRASTEPEVEADEGSDV